MDFIIEINDTINNLVWGTPMIALLLGVGILFTVRLGFIQITQIPKITRETLGKVFKKTDNEGDISSGQAALVSLAEVVGSGNIAGVATAVATGGPGALFWMWVAAFFGMATKFAEITLGIAYREKSSDGSYIGGAMFYIKNGIKNKKLSLFLSTFFAVMAIVAYIIIIAVVDTNTICLAVEEQIGISPIITGIVLMILTAVVILGGIKRLGKVCEYLTPIMGSIYVIAGILVIILNISKVPGAVATIVTMAFTPQSALGGFAGSSVMMMMKTGMARGMYSNEAGLGTGSILHAGAQTEHPVQQGLWGPMEVFIDTIIIATITGLVIVISGEWASGASGSVLTMNAFDSALRLPGVGSFIVFICAVLFGFSCLISASYVCEKSADYLWGKKAIMPVRLLWIAFIFFGAVGGLELVWDLADTANGLMAIPNLIGLIFLSGTVVKLKKDYFLGKKFDAAELKMSGKQ